MQPTAIAVIEQEVLKGHRWLPETGALRLRHLDRVPLEASYPDIVTRISTLLEASEIKDGEACGKPDMVLDVTGSGRAILEIFERIEIKPIVVNIVGAGVKEEETSDGWRVPKVELVGELRVAYELERLKMAKDLDLVKTLLKEMREFKMRPPRIDSKDPEAWREGQFDDLVFAVALAIWRASRHVPTPQVILDRYERAQRKRRLGSGWAV